MYLEGVFSISNQSWLSSSKTIVPKSTVCPGATTKTNVSGALRAPSGRAGPEMDQKMVAAAPPQTLIGGGAGCRFLRNPSPMGLGAGREGCQGGHQVGPGGSPSCLAGGKRSEHEQK